MRGPLRRLLRLSRPQAASRACPQPSRLPNLQRRARRRQHPLHGPPPRRKTKHRASPRRSACPTRPRDAQAQAALLAWRSARSDPLATESRVKSLLAADPGAHALNFTLGNQLAQQNRWGEAQQEYFKAYTAEPDNADFAYNLAVSLDHLRQPRQALDYYQRAIGLSEKRGASFDVAAARTRAATLAR